MRSAPELRPRCYFSLRSPYSFLALRRLSDEGFGPGSVLEYVPFFEPTGSIGVRLAELGGECLYAPMSRPRSRYVLSDVKRLFRAEGLSPRWPQDSAPDWSVPHLVFLACPPEARRAFVFAAMEARWLEGEDVCNWGKVAQLLEGSLGPRAADRLLSAARSEAIGNLAAHHLHCAFKDDVFGVPFMIVGRERFWGSDRIEPFITLMRERLGGTHASGG